MKYQNIVLVKVDKKRFGCDADYFKPDFCDKIISLQKNCTGGSASLPHSYNFLSESEIMMKLDQIDSLHSLVITESNCAHHLSYFLIRKAYKALLESKRADDRAKILVVNFDQHEDFGKYTDVFYCGNWGSRIFEEKGFDFMSVGCCENERVYARIQRHNDSAADFKLDYFEDFLNIYAYYDKIYVSVDMDVLTAVISVCEPTEQTASLPLIICAPFCGKSPRTRFSPRISPLPPIGEKTVNKRANIDDIESYVFDVKTAANILLGKLVSN